MYSMYLEYAHSTLRGVREKRSGIGGEFFICIIEYIHIRKSDAIGVIRQAANKLKFKALWHLDKNLHCILKERSTSWARSPKPLHIIYYLLTKFERNIFQSRAAVLEKSTR